MTIRECIDLFDLIDAWTDLMIRHKNQKKLFREFKVEKSHQKDFSFNSNKPNRPAFLKGRKYRTIKGVLNLIISTYF